MTTNHLHFEMRSAIAVIRLNRPAKRNALGDALILALRHVFEALPAQAKAAVLHGEGDHFCASLNLSELQERDVSQGLHHSRMWHAALDPVQSAPVLVVAALYGAFADGGPELASARRIRVADNSAFYALPMGSRGILVGNGGSVRIPKLIGVARMLDMMLTGRVYNAVDGEPIGLAQYLTPKGQAFDKALELAERIAQNAPLTHYALTPALPRIAEQAVDPGFFTEAKSRVKAVLDGKAAKVKQG